jgi:hypothetical protein
MNISPAFLCPLSSFCDFSKSVNVISRTTALRLLRAISFPADCDHPSFMRLAMQLLWSCIRAIQSLFASSRLCQHCRFPTIFSFCNTFNCQSSSWWSWCKPLLLSTSYERPANDVTQPCEELSETKSASCSVYYKTGYISCLQLRGRSSDILYLCSRSSYINFHYFSLSFCCLFLHFVLRSSFISF